MADAMSRLKSDDSNRACATRSVPNARRNMSTSGALLRCKTCSAVLTRHPRLTVTHFEGAIPLKTNFLDRRSSVSPV